MQCAPTSLAFMRRGPQRHVVPLQLLRPLCRAVPLRVPGVRLHRHPQDLRPAPPVRGAGPHAPHGPGHGDHEGVCVPTASAAWCVCPGIGPSWADGGITPGVAWWGNTRGGSEGCSLPLHACIPPPSPPCPRTLRRTLTHCGTWHLDGSGFAAWMAFWCTRGTGFAVWQVLMAGPGPCRRPPPLPRRFRGDGIPSQPFRLPKPDAHRPT